MHDTIINFGELLNQAIYTLGEQNCASADLCLGMGSSMRVQTLPEQCAINGGRFVIVNLQATPLDHLATLIIRAKCDDVMVMLMQKLGYQIPQWQMKKRVEVSLIDDGTKVQLRGVDETRNNFHLFKQIKVAGTARGETVASTKKVYPAASGPNTKQPYKFALPAVDARTEAF